KVTPPGRKPCDVGAAVFNVETVYNAYRALQAGEPVLEKYVTLAGAFARPVTLRVPVGTPFSALAKAAGGAAEGVVLLNGGPLSGRLAAPSDVVTKTTNAILALPETHPIVRRQRMRTPVQYLRARAACCQCGMCTALCPRRLIGYPIKPHAFMRAAGHGLTDVPDAYVQALYCSRCGLCEAFACGQGLSPRALLSSTALTLLESGVAAPEVPSPKPLPERVMRGISLDRLMGRLDLKRYARPAPYQPGGFKVSALFLPLVMHAGPPSIPVVSAGQAVSRGEMIAESEGLGAPIHAPLDGRVAQVTGAGIWLEGGDGLG
nr:4Fe-4S dicluster domain-containing protein [Clostridia bacterium]